MTVQEYIDDNLPFYHITKEDNVQNILDNGLLISKAKCRKGICVVRTKDEDVLNDIITYQLAGLESDSDKYALIQIMPSKHNVCAADVSIDPISMQDHSYANYYNYICKDITNIDEGDIIKRNMPRVDYVPLSSCEIRNLTGYLKEPPEPVIIMFND